ncbi:hypothetical protein Btru_036452 [Bulinus truncatus]|nr:hypothetical protein Btru_036452 [Bulinus truncatus]
MQTSSQRLVIRKYTNPPVSTLTLVASETQSIDTHHTISKISTEKEKKSVHFATDYEEVDDDATTWHSQHSSSNEDTLIPSEHHYSEDTFVSLSLNEETATEATSGDVASALHTDPSYGSSTFIPLDSSSESKTESDSSVSNTNSFASSSVFSYSSSSTSQDTQLKDGKTRTEIVKSIEDLEESEYYSRTDLPSFDDSLTLGSDLEDSDVLQKKFIESAIQQLKVLKMSVSLECEDKAYTEGRSDNAALGLDAKTRSQFCKDMVQLCIKFQKNQLNLPQSGENLNRIHTKTSHLKLEHYGLSSTFLDKLKLANLQTHLEKKMQDIDRDIEKSEMYIEDHQDIEDDIERDHFISRATSLLKKQNMEERIQEHKMKMQPELWFADLVRGLPRPDEETQNILDKYRQQVEDRIKITES